MQCLWRAVQKSGPALFDDKAWTLSHIVPEIPRPECLSQLLSHITCPQLRNPQAKKYEKVLNPEFLILKATETREQTSRSHLRENPETLAERPAPRPGSGQGLGQDRCPVSLTANPLFIPGGQRPHPDATHRVWAPAPQATAGYPIAPRSVPYLEITFHFPPQHPPLLE